MTEVKKLTTDGLKKLKDELRELKEVKRKQIVERIQEAKEHGDLSENAEYHEAREEQSFMEGRILELESIIKNAILLENDNSNDQKIVKIGSEITLEKEGEIYTYKIVGSTEADPKNNLISCDSPLGQAFINQKKGEIVSVKIPIGEMAFKIINIK